MEAILSRPKYVNPLVKRAAVFCEILLLCLGDYGNGSWLVFLWHYSDVIMSAIASQITNFSIVYSNGNIFRVLALCDGNPPVTGGFPSQRPVTRSFGVFFDLRLNKRLSKQWGRHRAHYDVILMCCAKQFHLIMVICHEQGSIQLKIVYIQTFGLC